MRFFKRLHPAAAAVYFAAVIGAAMFSPSSLLRAAALAFGIASGAFLRIFSRPKADFRFYLAVFTLITLTNPLFSHRGATVIFYLCGQPVTLEALLYGADTAAAVIAALIWFRIFSEVLTSDKLALLLGSASSSVGTLVMLVFRYVPTFRRRFSEISDAQKTAGFGGGETFFGRVKSRLNVFFSLAASSLELSVRSADSMKARGFSLSPHTCRRDFVFAAAEIFVIAFSLAAIAAVAAAHISGRLYRSFYPVFTEKNSALPIVLYSLLCAVPVFAELEERIKWKLYSAKI